MLVERFVRRNRANIIQLKIAGRVGRMSSFWDPFGMKEKKQKEYLNWLKIRSRENPKERIENPLPEMPTYVELAPKKCPDCKKQLEGWCTMLYGTPNTITCFKCNHKTETRWIKIEDTYTGPEIIITKDKPDKPFGTVKDLK